MMRGNDIVILVKSTNELSHVLKCDDNDSWIYYKTPDYEDYYIESEVEEVTKLEFHYISSDGENRLRKFTDINEMIKVFNNYNKYKVKTGITNLRLKFFS